VEENDDVAAELGIRNIPTIIFFKNGVEVDRHVGSAPAGVLRQKFEALL
jgi:thioredoxin 1